jgi:hypothetical protein
MKNSRCAFATMILAASLLGCGLMPKNNNRPTYVKDVVCYKEGDGFFAYIVLADSSGRPTCSKCKLWYRITTNVNGPDSEDEIFSDTIAIEEKDFKNAKVGLGAFEHATILFPIGRFPTGSGHDEMYTYKVHIKVTLPGGEELLGTGQITL